MSLTFDALRTANVQRMSQFKNAHGEPAHSTQDGSDWSPAQWLQAVVGELGEFATVRVAYEEGVIGMVEYRDKASKELADVVTYLDILARRAFDNVAFNTDLSPAGALMTVVAHLGEYANDRKKYERGDHSYEEFSARRDASFAKMQLAIYNLFEVDQRTTPQQGDKVTRVDDVGVNLGIATVRKFNEVSKRVGCDVTL